MIPKTVPGKSTITKTISWRSKRRARDNGSRSLPATAKPPYFFTFTISDDFQPLPSPVLEFEEYMDIDSIVSYRSKRIERKSARWKRISTNYKKRRRNPSRNSTRSGQDWRNENIRDCCSVLERERRKVEVDEVLFSLVGLEHVLGGGNNDTFKASPLHMYKHTAVCSGIRAAPLKMLS